MPKRKKRYKLEIPNEIKAFELPQWEVKEADRLFWEFKDYRELKIHLRTPKVMVRGEWMPERLFAYPIDLFEDFRNVQLNHLFSGFNNGKLGMATGVLAPGVNTERISEDDGHWCSAMFEDPNDLLIFKLTVPTL